MTGIEISANSVRTMKQIVIVPNYREGMAFGTVQIAWHNGERQYHVIANLRKRQMPPKTSVGIGSVVSRSRGYMRQVSSEDPSSTRVLFRGKELAEVVTWANRQFNLHLEAIE